MEGEGVSGEVNVQIDTLFLSTKMCYDSDVAGGVPELGHDKHKSRLLTNFIQCPWTHQAGQLEDLRIQVAEVI